MSVKRPRPVTGAFLAQICGVSQGTVDRALHGRSGISERTREKILAAAKEYGYRPNLLAQGLVGGKTGVIGIVVFDLYNAYFSRLIMQLEATLSTAGLLPLIMFSQKDAQRELQCIETLYAMGADGLILCPVSSGAHFGEYIDSMGIPSVTFGNRVPGVAHVGVDDFAAMAQLTRTVLERDVERLVYVSPPLAYENQNIDAQKRRYDGFVSVVREKGVAHEILTRWPDNPAALASDEKTVVMASTDLYALRLMHAGVPETQLTGFDGVADEAYRGAFATVECDSEKTARTIAAFFVEGKPPHSVTIAHRIRK